MAEGVQGVNDWHPPGAEGNPQGAGENGGASRSGTLAVPRLDDWAAEAGIAIPAISSAPLTAQAKPLVTVVEATIEKLASKVAKRCDKRIYVSIYRLEKDPKSHPRRSRVTLSPVQ
jgi:hypothetical protein